MQHEAGLVFIAAAGKLIDALSANGDTASAQTALKIAHSAYLAHRAGVDISVKDSVAFAESSAASFESTSSTMAKAEWGLLALAALGLAGFGMWIRRVILAAVGG